MNVGCAEEVLHIISQVNFLDAAATASTAAAATASTSAATAAAAAAMVAAITTNLHPHLAAF